MACDKAHCSFCGVEQGPELPLIAGEDGHICEECVRLASQVVASWGRKRALAGPLKTPPAATGDQRAARSGLELRLAADARLWATPSDDTRSLGCADRAP